MREVHIIGDSNFSAIAEALNAIKGRKPWKDLIFTRSSSNASTIAALDDIGSSNPVVFMGISLNEMGKQATANPEDWKTTLDLDLDAFQQLKTAKPDGKILLVSPFPRPGSPIHPQMANILANIKDNVEVNDVLKCNVTEKELAIDKIHLNKHAIAKVMKTFLAEIKDASRQETDLSQTPARNTRKRKPGLAEVSESEDDEPDSAKKPRPASTEDMIEALYNNMTKQGNREKEVKHEFHSLALVTAEMKESIDDTDNQKTRNILVIKNLKKLDKFAENRDNNPRSFAEQLCDKLKLPKKPIEYAHIFPIGNERNKKSGIRIAFKKTDDAEELKKLYIEACKADKYDLRGSTISHQVTNSTRIRAQVLYQLAESLKTSGEDAWTNPNLSTPILLIKSKEGRKRIKSYKYTEALKKFSEAVKKTNLDIPKQMAERMYPDTKKQLFIIL